MINLRKLPPVSLFIGLPGSGKTSVASAFVKQCNSFIHKKKITVYSNVPIIGAYQISKADIGTVQLEPGSLLIFDEAGLEFDNRDFDKNFKGEQGKKMLQFFKLIRHYQVKLIVLSQSADIDKKIRDLAGVIYLVKKSFIPGFSVFIRVRRSISISQDQTSICDIFDMGHPFIRLFSPRLFRPRTYKLFNSWDAPELPYKEFEKYEST